MSSMNGITGGSLPALTGGARSPSLNTAAETDGVSPSLRERLKGVIGNSYRERMATVYERGAAGEFDDPQLRIREQALLAKLENARKERDAEQAQQTPDHVNSGGNNGGEVSGSVVGGGAAIGGANAAPRPEIAAQTPQIANAAPVPDSTQDAEQELLENRVSQSEARLEKISQSLAATYDSAASIPPTNSGTWDPRSFVPQSREQAAAVADRLTVDSIEAAARLDIQKAELDVARFEARRNPSPAANQRVAALERDFERQVAWVDNLATIVDDATGGQLSSIGAEALVGTTLRDVASGDIGLDEIVSELRESGVGEAAIKRLLGTGELAIEEQRSEGGSDRLRNLNQDMAHSLYQRMELSRQERRAEAKREELARAADSRRQDRRVEAQNYQRTSEQKIADAQLAEGREMQRANEFEQWLELLQIARSRANQQSA